MIGISIADINLSDAEIDKKFAETVEYFKKEDEGYVPEREHIILDMISNLIYNQCNQREDIGNIKVIRRNTKKE